RIWCAICRLAVRRGGSAARASVKPRSIALTRADFQADRTRMDERDDGMLGWDVLEPPKTGPFLPSDDPLVKALGQPGERVFPALDVIDWWEHPDAEARRIPTGIAGA